MLTLISCGRTCSVSPYVRDAGDRSRLLCNFLLSGLREFSSVDAEEGRDEVEQFTVSSPVRSCGSSLKSAKYRAKFVHFNSPEKSDHVMKLFKEYGFSSHQITKIVNVYPRILARNPADILAPKLEFIGSIGFSGIDRTKLITSCPRILAASLHNTLIPSHRALKSLLTDDEILRCLRRSPRLIMVDVPKHLASKLSILSSQGVPQAHIRSLIKSAPRLLSYPAEDFNQSVKKIVDYGFDPTKLRFIYAVAVICQQHTSKWEQKISVFKSLGWSEDDLLLTFKVAPLSMAYSEKKIRKVVDFYTSELGWTPSLLAQVPVLMGLSLEKRIKPRCLVMSILWSQGLLEKDSYSYAYVLQMGHKTFMDRFVTKYLEAAPLLSTVFPVKSVRA